MKHFDEAVFLWSLCSRPEDARIFSSVFRPEWLENPGFQAVLAEVYRFTKQHAIPPSLNVLRQIFKDDDPEAYELRFGQVLDLVEQTNPDLSEQIYCLTQATDVAKTRSFMELVNDPDFRDKITMNEGYKVTREVAHWLQQFSGTKDEESASIKEAVTGLLELSSNASTKPEKIPTGIRPIDAWTNEGLRTGQLGILLAPTGHGKSAVLLNMAYKMAIQDEYDVWFVTNELTMAEQTERFLARLTDTSMQTIQTFPHAAVGEALESYWQYGMDDRLRLTSLNKQVSADDIEAMMTRWANISGWKPKVIVLDFMERMAPVESGYSRDKEWNWMGAIAEDLVRVAKRHNILIWTAAQTNRSGLQQGVPMGGFMAQGSIKHLQAASGVVMMRKVYMTGEEGSGMEKVGIEFTPDKMRHSKGGDKPTILEVDLSKMYITDKEIDQQVVVEEMPEPEKRNVTLKKGDKK